MFIVISYDISEDKRRTKIHKILKSYGQWMQFSLFECELNDAQYSKLRSRLSKLIKPNEDSIRFYFLCGGCQPKIERIGGGLMPGEKGRDRFVAQQAFAHRAAILFIAGLHQLLEQVIGRGVLGHRAALGNQPA